MKIGARIIKSGVAVATAIYLCQLLKVEPSTFSAISALLNVQPSVHLSLKKSLEQVLVHIIGVGLAFVLGYFLGANPLSIGLGTIILIWLLLNLNLSNGITMGVVALVFILASAPKEFIPHALSRSAGIFIGLGVGMAINPLLAPPRHKHKFQLKLREFSEASIIF
ncbi:MAG: FUSC family protein, partial [Carboxydocellales bacterium]